MKSPKRILLQQYNCLEPYFCLFKVKLHTLVLLYLFPFCGPLSERRSRERCSVNGTNKLSPSAHWIVNKHSFVHCETPRGIFFLEETATTSESKLYRE